MNNPPSSALRHNLDLVEKRFPAIARLAGEGPSDGIEPLRARDGGWTARMNGRLLYSRYAPLNDFLPALEKVRKMNADSLVVFGVGLGHGLLEVMKWPDLKRIWAYEPDPRLLKLFLELEDRSSVLLDPRLVLTTDCSKILEEVTSAFDRSAGGCRIRVLPDRHHERAFPEELLRLTDTLREGMEFWSTLETPMLYRRNELENAPLLPNASNVLDAAPALAGRPVIVAGAGPSLAQHFEALKRCRTRAVLFAADAALKPLLARGVEPDFVFSSESTYDISRFYDDLQIPEQTIRVFALKTHPATVARHAGPNPSLYLSQGGLFDALLSHALGLNASTPDGYSISCAAVSSARLAGCSSIILVGQDHAVSSESSYVEGSAIQNRMKTFKDDPGNPFKVEVPGYNGDFVLTSPQLKAALDWLEQFAVEWGHRVRLLNCTEGGAAIRGFQPMPLERAAEEFFTTDVEKEFPPAAVRPFLQPRQMRQLSDWLRKQTSKYFNGGRDLRSESRRIEESADSLATEDGSRDLARHFNRVKSHLSRLPVLQASTWGMARIDELADRIAGASGPRERARWIRRFASLVNLLSDRCDLPTLRDILRTVTI